MERWEAVAVRVRLVAFAVGDRYIAETDEEYLDSGLKVCRIYFPDDDSLVPGWRLPLGSFVKFSDPWDVEEVSLPDAERERIQARITALIEAEAA